MSLDLPTSRYMMATVPLGFLAGLAGPTVFRVALALAELVFMTSGALIAADYHGVAVRLRADQLRQLEMLPRWAQALPSSARQSVRAHRLTVAPTSLFGLLLLVLGIASTLMGGGT